MRAKHHSYGTRGQRGFSMIELMTVVAIVAIMMGLAIPSFQEFVVNYRTSVQSNDLLADLAIARSEAVKFGRRTEVRSVGGGWTNGWVVGTDLNADGNLTGTEIIKEHGAAPDGFTIEGGDTGGTAATEVAFGITGQVVAPGGVNPIEFAICRPDGDAAKSRGVTVARSGRAGTQKASVNTGIQC
jgi:type IV fimbrial biogenesis protein FimT